MSSWNRLASSTFLDDISSPFLSSSDPGVSSYLESTLSSFFMSFPPCDAGSWTSRSVRPSTLGNGPRELACCPSSWNLLACGQPALTSEGSTAMADPITIAPHLYKAVLENDQ